MPAVKMPSGVVPRDPTSTASLDDRDKRHDVARCSSAPLSDTTPTPLLPPPGPQPARRYFLDDDVSAAVPVDGALDLLLQTVPRIVRSKEELAEAPIEHRDWYILALLDEQTSVQGLVDIAGMAPHDVLRILRRLRRLGLITLA
jgi:hypothetical protein